MIMKRKNNGTLAGLVLLLFFAGCSGHQQLSDAYGNFEATTLLVSAETGGRLLSFEVEEGVVLASGDTVGLVDTTVLALKKKTLHAKAASVRARAAGLTARKKVMLRQLENLVREQKRVRGLYEGHAATRKQLDDIDGQVEVMRLQIGELETQRQSVLEELGVIAAEMAAVDEQISRSFIVVPGGGTVLEKYVEQGELVAPGKMLFKLGDMKNMFLRVYVDETLLPQIKTGGKAEILIDRTSGMDTLSGTVAWVSGEAEFTPKIIQTRKERVNLVYAVKILVKNDGRLKIGMPGEANFR